MRLRNCFAIPPLDAGAKLLTAIVLAVSLWIFALPVSQTLQRWTLDRFHLRSSHYLLWAAQQPIPAMYSFENRYWLMEPGQSGAATTAAVDWGAVKESRLINHFPVRIFTFGDNRYRLLRDGQPVSLVVRSRYRGEDLSTLFQAVPEAAGGYRLQRTDLAGATP